MDKTRLKSFITSKKERVKNKGFRRKLLKAKMLNYVSVFAEQLNKLHPETQTKYRIDEEDSGFLVEDYLGTFVEDMKDIEKAYNADDTGETLEKLWNGSYNYNIDDE